MTGNGESGMEFKLDDHGFSWIAKARFASWTGYLDRSGAYGGMGGSGRSDGAVEIVFAPEGRDSRALTESEMGLVNWLLENEPCVSEAVKSAIFQRYPDFQEDYGYSPEERAEFMPDLQEADGLRSLIGLYAVNVHQVDKGGLPYLGFEFGCTWDEEHGVGVLTHGTRIVEVGGSDAARLLWMAQQDASNT